MQVGNRHIQNNRKGMMLTFVGAGIIVLLLAVLVIGAIILTERYKTRTKIQKLTEEINQTLTNHRMFSAREILETVAGFSEMIQLCRGGKTETSPVIQNLMRVVKNGSGASVVYIMNNTGLVVASTFYDEKNKLTGNNYAFRKYFKDALQGESGIDAAMGVTSHTAGFYLSRPIWDEANFQVLGVIVAKFNLSILENILKGFSEIFFLVSPDGAVMASNEEEFRFHIAYPILQTDIDVLKKTRRIGMHSMNQLPFSLLENEVRWKNRRYAIVQIETFMPGWKIFGMKQIRFHMFSIVFGGMIFLTAVLSWIGVYYGIKKNQVSEKQLEKMMGMYSSLTQVAPDAIGLFDFRGRIISGNEQMAFFFSTGAGKTFEGNTLYDFIRFDDRVPVKLFIKELLTQKHSRQIRFYLNSGIPVEMNASPYHDETQHKKAFHAVIRDVSWRQQAEDSLHNSEEKFKKLIENIGMGIIVVDPKLNILYMNDKIHSVFPKMIDQVQIENLFNIGISDNGYYEESPLRKAFADGHVHEMTQQIMNDGNQGMKHLRLILSPVKNKDREVNAVIIMVEDITEREQLLENLAASRKQFQTLISNFPGVVYRCMNDTRWTMEFISEGIEILAGYPTDDFIQNAERSYTSIIHPKDRARVWERVEAAIAAQESFVLKYRIIHKNGEIKWVYEKGQVITDEQGNVICLEGAVFDISDKSLSISEK